MLSIDSASGARRRPERDERDLAAMAGIRDGDAAALEALMARYWPRLVAYARRLLGSADEAEDVVQETFVRLWQRRGEFQLSGSVRSYLYQVARNIIRDEGRKGRIRARWAEKGQELGSLPTDPAQNLEAAELRMAVDREIQALPPRRREAFVLAHFHDLTYRQIAEIMGVSSQTVANQISAGLSDLRQALAPYLTTTSDRDRGRSQLSFPAGYSQSTRA